MHFRELRASSRHWSPLDGFEFVYRDLPCEQFFKKIFFRQTSCTIGSLQKQGGFWFAEFHLSLLVQHLNPLLRLVLTERSTLFSCSLLSTEELKVECTHLDLRPSHI